MIGWVYFGLEPESNHLRDSLEEVSKLALVVTEEGDQSVSPLVTDCGIDPYAGEERYRKHAERTPTVDG